MEVELQSYSKNFFANLWKQVVGEFFEQKELDLIHNFEESLWSMYRTNEQIITIL